MKAPPNVESINDALQVVSAGKIKNVVNAYGATTILNPNEVRELFDKWISSKDTYGFASTQAWILRLPKELRNAFSLYNWVINNQNIPVWTRSFIAKALNDVNDGSLMDSVEVAMVEFSESNRTEILSALELIRSTKRRADLGFAVYTAIEKNDIAWATRIATSFPSKTPEDIQAISDVIWKIEEKKLFNVFSEFSATFTKTPRNYDACFEVLGRFTSSASPLALPLAISLAASVWAEEINTNIYRICRYVWLSNRRPTILAEIGRLRIRPDVEAVSHTQKYTELKDFVNETYDRLEIVFVFWEIDAFRKTFDQPYATVRASIDALPGNTGDEVDFRERIFREYTLYLQQRDPPTYQRQIAEPLVAQARESKRNAFRPAPILPKNREVFRYLHQRFELVFKPLLATFEQDSMLGKTMEGYLKVERAPDGSVISNRQTPYVQRIRELEKQRDLTEIEREYLKTIEYISLFNPYLIALANADQAIVGELLHHHFDSLSTDTIESLEDGQYVPAIVVWTWPSGATALWEIGRNNSELLSQILVIDDAKYPGGPFAIPNGRAWELNSANRRWKAGYTLPEKPANTTTELQTVRAYGASAGRRYPGERESWSGVRQGSINATVDWLATPDDISDARYPNNQDEALIIQMQVALLTQRLALRTRVISIQPNRDTSKQWDKVVTLDIPAKWGWRKTVRIYTDACMWNFWLWRQNYGFKLEGSRAEKIIEAKSGEENTSFPRLSTTLEAFGAFADKTIEKQSPGKTFIIYGNGNSCDTLLEYIGNLFEWWNKAVRSVEKIYVVTTGDFSKRPRYRKLVDLFERNGKANLVEVVRAKVWDVGLDRTWEDKDSKVNVYDQNKAIITVQWKPIQADSIIAATGFMPELNSIFKAYLKPWESFADTKGETGTSPLSPIVLPTNPDVAVGEYLTADPNITFFGTSSNPRFNRAKFAQLPDLPRNALLRNGAENAVAIGFRAPDTQAAINIWLAQREITLSRERPPSPHIYTLDWENGTTEPIQIQKSTKKWYKLPNDINRYKFLLSTLINYEFGKWRYEIKTPNIQDTGLSFIISQNPEGIIVLDFSSPIPSDFRKKIEEIFQMEDIQTYIYAEFRALRGKEKKLKTQLFFKNWKLNLKEGYTESWV